MFNSRFFKVISICCLMAAWSGTPAWALNGAQVAIYNDIIAPEGTRGVWQTGLTAIESMLTWAGITYEEINYNDLNSSTQNFSDLYQVMIFPGGNAGQFNYWISKAGKARIQNFVADGGGFLGICAGGYFASDRMNWYGVLYDDDIMYNAYGERTGYDLDLFPGIGTGPLDDIANYAAGQYNMATMNFTSSTVLGSDPKPKDILYYGGAYFTADIGATVEILATYQFNNEPGMVACTYQSGKVALFGPHPEIEEDSTRDATAFGKELDDNDTDWRLLQSVLTWLGASSSSTVSGDYSRYGFTYYYDDGSGDYYTGFVYAPKSFQTSSPYLTVGAAIYYQPMSFWGGGNPVSLGGHYYITSITDGYDASYDKQSYITHYYDASLVNDLEVNATQTALPSYLGGHIHVLDRTASNESGYALYMNQYGSFDPFTKASFAATAPEVAVAPAPAASQVYTAYWTRTGTLLDEEF